MPSAAFNKFDCFVKDEAEKLHNLASDTLKVALTNTAPIRTQTAWSTANHPAPATANGYAAGGNTVTQSSSQQTNGLYKLVVASSTFTASGGAIGPFRYAVLYNSTSANRPIGWYDYGSSITLNDGESLVVDFDAVNGALQKQ